MSMNEKMIELEHALNNLIGRVNLLQMRWDKQEHTLRVCAEAKTNGYVLTRYDDEYPRSTVHEIAEDYSDSCTSLSEIAMLYEILEALGIYHGKHAKHRIQIRCSCEPED